MNSGRVTVKVTEENGRIMAGDLITTSSKAIDCVGAVVGIAMQNQKKDIEGLKAQNQKLQYEIKRSK